ncbi:outer membrane beta-barrel protein [Sediminibacterium soli]|uniref:outer membrane beta-barrel protein n=1 Tax=Sediminibacterium soli TaxID=2698829 RepID=UPI00137B3238|nr:outer membrane beta-barrel protein [Sediminibacterium soli]NCI45639.1 TonB-dependent receptor [Sediminibacterium soli]
MKHYYFCLCLLFAAGFAAAQTGTITGFVKDSGSAKTLGLATVTIFKAKDTSIVTYRLSNPEGEFKVGGLPLNLPLRMIITFSGYQPLRKEFLLTAEHPNRNMDTVKMTATTQQLDEVIVIAERPPVSIKNDTIEFNATAFKTLPNALVEDLLKKLPGVQVDADGNITVNGKAVNRILVDGKTFFGSDPKMATRNLPANIIDKVQVTDDKEELLRNGDDNLNNVGKVVNITLKKGVKKGWFGKVYAGKGSADRYEAGAIANIFRDTMQLSVLGYVNNLNKPGFGYSDLMQTGGLDRSNSNLNSRSTSIWSNGSGGSGIMINGISFGGMTGSGGVVTSKGGGFNLNHAPNARQSIFGQYFFGNAVADRRQESEIRQYNADTVVTNRTQLTGDVITNAHNIGIGGKFKPDTLTTIQVSMNYTIGLQDEYRFSDIRADNNLRGPLSTGMINQTNKSNTYYYRHGFMYTRLSPTKKGRRFNLVHNLDINNRFNNYYTNSSLHYIRPTAYDSLLDQLRREDVPRTDLSAAFNYSDPLGKKWTLRVGGRYEYGKLVNAIATFNPNSTDKKYDVINRQLSSNFFRENHRFFAAAGFEYKAAKDLTITPSVRGLVQEVNNALASLPQAIRQSQRNLLPALTVVYKQLNLNYSEDISLPAYAYLLPVADNTNPYNISRGNPDLLPSERHNFSVNYYFNDTKRNLNIGLYANGGFVKNDVVQSIHINQTGIQTNMPVNADGSSNFGINYNINKQYKSNPKFIVSWNAGAWYGFNKSKLLYNGETGWQSTFNLNQWSSLNFNLNDKFEWNNSYSIGYNFTEYTSQAFKTLKVVSHYANTEMISRHIKHVILESSLNYNYNGNIPAGLPKGIVRWNAAVNITMLKDEKGVLKLSVFDILNQNAGVSMYANRNTVNIFRTNVLSQYFMATFTYNIRAIGGAKKKVGGERLFNF